MTPGTIGPKLNRIIVPASRGAQKLRKQMPPTIAADDTVANIAMTQSPLANVTSAPNPTLALQATANSRCRSVGVLRPAMAALLATMSSTSLMAQTATSRISQARNGAVGCLMAQAAATTIVLMAPPTKIDRVP